MIPLKQLLVALSSLFLMLSCSQTSRPNLENNGTEIQNLLYEQRDSWNNGDLQGFMSYYWENDSLCFLSKNGINCGWQSIYDNYQRGYSTPEKMGKLDFSILKSLPMNDSTHFLVGRWKVMRSMDTLGGSFNLIWQKKEGEWVIVFDHTS